MSLGQSFGNNLVNGYAHHWACDYSSLGMCEVGPRVASLKAMYPILPSYDKGKCGEDPWVPIVLLSV